MKEISIADFIKKYKFRIGFLTFIAIIDSLFLFIAPLILKHILDINNNIDNLQIWVIMFFLSIVLSYILHLIRIQYTLKFKYLFKTNESHYFFSIVSKINLSRFDEKGPTYFTSRITSTVSYLFEYINSISSQLVVSIIIVITSLIIAYSTNKIICVLFIALLPISYYSYKYLNKKLSEKSEELQSCSANNSKDLISLFKNIIVIKQIYNYGKTSKIASNFISNIQSKENEINSYAQIMSRTIVFITDSIKYIIVFSTIYLYIKDEFTVSNLMFINMVLGIYFSGLNSLVLLNISKRDVTASLKFINNEIMNHTETDTGNNEINEINSIKVKIKSFMYNNSKNSNIKDLELEITKGYKFAFVGSTGSGKSTIAKLIADYYEAEEITINNRPLCEYKLSHIREKIYLCFQDAFIIPGTLENNITIAIDDVNLAKKRLEDIMKYDIFNDFINSLPLGLSTIMNESVSLSGGQKQIIALMRMLITRPEVIILDESTSALDGYSENRLIEIINEVFNNKIIIKISHRLSFIKDCNKIILMNNGKIDCIGTHNELFAKSELYKKIFNSQS